MFRPQSWPLSVGATLLLIVLPSAVHCQTTTGASPQTTTSATQPVTSPPTMNTDVVLSSSLDGTSTAYPQQVINFTCVTRGSPVLAWSSDDYIGDGVFLEFSSVVPVGTTLRAVNSDTVAVLVDVSMESGVTVLESTLQITVSSQFSSSSVACLSPLGGISSTTSFRVIPAATITPSPPLSTTGGPGAFTTPGPSCSDFDLRLTNTSVALQDTSLVYSGNVEVCLSGTYFSICDTDWDDVEAQLICNAVGYFAPLYRGVAVRGLAPTSQPVFENVMCPSDATSALNCSFVSPPMSPRCFSGFGAAGIQCISQVNTTVVIPDNFLPFGLMYGDSVIPPIDDGSSQEVLLGTDVIIFGSRNSRLYVSTNGVVSFGQSYPRISSGGSDFDFVSSPPIIAPFWDDINVLNGGMIYYRQEFNSSIADLVAEDLSSQYPEVGFFYPSLVFVATWDRVASFYSNFGGLYNTFQVIIASDGSRSFVKFIYGDIEWGGSSTLIGVSAGDRLNFVTHPASLSSNVLLLDGTNVTYRIDLGNASITPLPPTTSPPGNGTFECTYDGDINTYFSETSNGRPLRRYEGVFEVCVDGFYGSVCDIGWNEAAAQAICRDRFGTSFVGEPLFALGYPNRTYVAQNFDCPDFAYGFSSCSYNDTVESDCFFGPHVAGVRCTENCSDGDIRLFNLNYTYDNGLQTVQAHVLVCLNGSYLPVCDLGWDDRDAQVVCNNQFGSNYIGEVFTPRFPLNFTGSRNYVAQDVMCNGTESYVSECAYSPPTPACYEGNRAAGVTCREVCSEGVVRLVNQSYLFVDGLSSTGGIVQVCVNQQFGYICADGWDNREADVVCRSQSTSYQAPYYVNTASTTSMVFDNAPVYRYSMCNGTEYMFNECQLPVFDSDSTCPSFATVNCTEVISRCYGDGDFRLANESTNFTSGGAIIVTGRIEVCSNFSYTSLCSQYWDPIDAQVFCENYLNSRGYYSNITGYPAFPSQYGYSNAGIVAYNVTCNGTESRIEDCDRFPGSSPLCEDPATSAAGVVCVSTSTVSPTVPTPSCVDSSLRLANQVTSTSSDGLVTIEGHVEICLSGTYYAICDEGWDDRDAQVACRALTNNIGTYNATALRGLMATAQIIAENVTCLGNETDASQCNATVPVMTPRCFVSFPGAAAGVRCAQVGGPDVVIPEGFLPFGPAYGDSALRDVDDGSSTEIQLGTDVVIFGARSNRLYVNTNGVLSFGRSYTSTSSGGSNFSFVSSPPIIAPFWDDIDIRRGGVIYYRQVVNSFIIEQVQLEVSSQYPEVGFFYPSLVFVATWDRVAPYSGFQNGLVNTFQVIIASDGSRSFVGFTYDDIGWGGSNTLIGVSAGDRVNYITHPASLSSDIQFLDGTNISYRIDVGNATIRECFNEGEIISYLNYTFDGFFSRYEGDFEICIGGVYGSVCDIGWDDAAAQAFCRDRYGSNYVAEALSEVGYPRRRYVAQNFSCPGFTYGLRNCIYSSFVDPECSDGPHVAGVRCRETCAEGDVRLLNETSDFSNSLYTFRGQVVVCVNGTYQPVCDIGWDNNDAQVVCNLRYGSRYDGEAVLGLPLYQNASYVAQDIMCNGTEFSADQCPFSPPTPACYEGNHGAGVICRQVCFEGDVRLLNTSFGSVNGMSTVYGVVQVCINQQFGYVCSEGWDDREAEVACRTYNYNYRPPFYVATASTSMLRSDAPLYHDAMCNGTEESFTSCQLPYPNQLAICPSIGAVTCTEVITRCPYEGQFILANSNITFRADGSIEVTGRVEVCANFTYGSVCDYGWDQADADVFCRNYVQNVLGIFTGNVTAYPVGGSIFGYSNNGIVLEDVRCTSFESSLEACSRSPFNNFTQPQCLNEASNSAGVVCTISGATPPTCQPFDLRLANQTSSIIEGFYQVYEGNVETCINGTYSSICDVGWDDIEAQLICNALGYAEPFYRGVALRGLMATAPPGLDNVMCPSNATSALNCSFNIPPVSPQCYSNFSAAGVRCVQERMSCSTNGEFNAVNITYDNYLGQFGGGGFSLIGKIGVCLDGVLGSVCDVNWDVNDATVFCNGIGLGENYVGTPLYGFNIGADPIVLDSVDCTGMEPNISSCQTSQLGSVTNPMCQDPNRAAGIRCSLPAGSCIDGQTRLVDGPAFYEGRLEVCLGNQWLSVCDAGFNSATANDVCNSRLLLFGDATPVYGAAYGQGTGPLLTACSPGNFSSFINYVPLGNCATMQPDLSCSHERDVGVQCTPGQVSVLPIPVGTSRYGYPFAVQCFAQQFPWEAALVSSGWYDNYGNPVIEFSRGGPVNITLLQDMYNSAAFNLTYIFRNQLNFNHPLSVSDGGYYSCNVSVEITYPDNSTTVLSNSAVFPLVIVAPEPTVFISATGSQEEGSRFEASCVVYLPSPELTNYTFIEWVDLLGNSIPDQPRFRRGAIEYRVQVLPVQRINDTHIVRQLVVDPLQATDEGLYMCQAYFAGLFLTSPNVSVPAFLEVFGNGTVTTDIPVVTTPAPSCDDFDLRLVNTSFVLVDSNPAITGNVEACLGGSYISVCDVGWDDVEAQLFCNALGYSEPFYRGVAVRGLTPTSQPAVENVMCPSNATSASNCSFSPLITPRCFESSSAAGVQCIQDTPPPGCTEFDLRLTNTSFSSQDVYVVYESNVEICINGTYVAICDLGWDDVEAQLACNIAGYDAPFFRGTAIGGLRATAPIGVENVMCSSNTTRPEECPAIAPPESQRCFSNSNAAGVRCTQVISQCLLDGQLRLANVSNSSSPDRLSAVISGRVEVCYNGTFGSVCDSGWDEPDARVFCTNFLSNLLGIPTDVISGANAVGGSLYGYSLTGIVLENVMCEGFESSLGGCLSPPLGRVLSSQCQNPSTDAAGVMCFLRQVTLPPRNDTRPDVFVFGPEVGDQMLPTVDDGSSPEIVLNTSFVFFGYSYTRLYISTNGIFSFDSSFTRFQPTPFPFISPPLIAPFWADFDLRRGGSVFYRQTADPDILQPISYTTSQVGEFQFVPTLALIATWDGVPAFDGRFRNLTNTFQAILATNGSHSFAGFIYRDIQWGETVEIGFNAGDGRGYYSPLTSADALGEGRESNVMSPGVYVYRTDNLASPEPPTTVEPPTPTPPPPFCNEGELRVLSSNYSTMRSMYGTRQDIIEFRFEVCTGDRYASVCDIGWDDADATVACYELGYYDATATALPGLMFSRQEEVFGVQGVECNGTEYMLSECQNSTMISDECLNGSHVAGVRCVRNPRPCSHGDVRAVNLTYSNIMVNGEYLFVVEGAAEQCIDGFVGPVCDIGWDNADATAFCLRYQRGDYIGEAILGVSSSNSYIAQDFMCNGTEYDGLVDCSYSNATEACYGQHVAGFRCTQVVPQCTTGDYRVRNETFTYDETDIASYSGRIEVCMDGRYIALCDSGFTAQAAELACRSQNREPPFFRAEVLRGNFTDFYSGSVYSGRFNCSENAYSLSDCRLIPDESCVDVGPSRAVGFRCVRELLQCYGRDGGDFRQRGGQFTYFTDSGFNATGRVDVCFNQTFGSVCSRGWDDYDAMAFCRYSYGDGTMGRVVNGSEFGISGIGIVLTDVKCSGSREEQITDCSYGELGRQVGTLEGCSGVMDVAGVVCSRECDSGYVRLVGGESYYEGRVEVCQNSRWTTICDVGWDNVDATIACRSIDFFGGGEAINGSMFGSTALSFGASDVQCFGREFYVSECRNESVIPTECTASRIAGARCVPGSIVVEIVSEGAPMLGSSGYTLQCNAVQFPWNAQLVRYRWNNTVDSPLMSDSRLNISLLNSTYDASDRVFVFNSSIQFNPLTFQDAGYITCGLALNLTYPDGPNNSSIVIMNRTTTIITIEVPPPSVRFVSEDTPINNQPYTAACVAQFVAAVPMSMVTIEWMNQDGGTIPDIGGNRITESPIRRIDDRTYARDLSVSSLRVEDSGTYTCEAAIMAEFVTSQPASESFEFVVFGQAELAIDQEITAVVLNSSTSTGGVVTFVCSVFGSPYHPNVTWQYIGPDGSDPIALPDGIIPVENETSATNLTSTITIQDVRFMNRGIYRCTTGTGLSDDVQLVIAVTPQLTVTSEPVSTTLTEQDSLRLICSTSDYYPRTSITWFKGGTTLSRTSRIVITESSNTVDSGLYQTQSNLSIASTLTSDTGAYYCKAILQIDDRIPVVTVRVDRDLNIMVQARNECIISESPELVTPCVNGYCVDGVGDYSCRCFENFQGRDCNESVPINQEPIAPIIIAPPMSRAFLLGDLANISCLATGIPAPSYRWFFNGVEIEGETFPYYIIFSIAPEHRGIYNCTATNEAGSDTSDEAQITIDGVQQYTMAFVEPARRRRQSDTVTMFIDSLVGTPLGDTGVTIYAAEFQAGSILVTLNAGSGEFPEVGLTDSLQAAANGVATNFGINVTGVQRFDGCPSEERDGFIWPESDLNLLRPVAVSCNCGSVDTTVVSLQAIRNCTGSYTGGASWMGPGNSTACRFSNNVASLCLSTGTTEVAVASVLAFTQNTTAVVDPTSVAIAITILSQNTSALQDETIRLEVVDSVSNLQNVDRTTLQESQTQATVTNLVIDIVEDVIDSLPLDGDMPTTIVAANKELAVTAIAPEIGDFPGVSFEVNFNDDGSISEADASLTPSATAPTSLSIPQSLLEDLGVDPADVTDFRVGFSVFRDDSLFQPRSSGEEAESETLSRIGSSVISAQVSGLGVPVANLKTPVLVELSVKPFSDIPGLTNMKEEEYDRTLMCVFWDPTLDEGFGNWSSTGCRLNTEVDDKAFCECDHLTSFALLMDVSPKPVEETTATLVLEIITYVGLAISIIGLLLTIITYLVVRKLRTSDVGQMLLNLCFALLGLYVAFLISTSAETLASTEAGRNACGFFSALLHYFMLAYFFWTAAEALFLFFKLVKVLRGSMNTYVYVAMAICWIVPVIIVAISLGGYQYYLSDTFCRPIQWPFWFGFIAPFALIYAFNWVMFIVIMVALCLHSKRTAVMSAKDTNVKSVIAKHLLIAVVLSLLFGLGWAFGLIGTSSLPQRAYTPAQYIFSIFMGIQGVLIFILHAVRSREAREEWKKWWYTVTCRRNSYELKRRASFTVTSSSSRGRMATLETSTAVLEKSMPYHEAEEVVPLSPKNTSDDREKEMQAAVTTSTTVENIYVVDPTDGGQPEKVDLSSNEGKRDETSKL